MGNFADSIRKVKENSVRAAAENQTAEAALRDLCETGEHTAAGVTYTLTVSGPHGHQTFDGHRFASTGNAYHRSTLLSYVLSWLVRPIEQVVVVDAEITELDGLYAHAECPFGCRRSERTGVMVSQDHVSGGHAYRRIDVSYRWHGCEHLVGEVKSAQVAVFAAASHHVRRCEHCAAWTDDRVDTCAHCNETRLPVEEDSRDE